MPQALAAVQAPGKAWQEFVLRLLHLRAIKEVRSRFRSLACVSAMWLLWCEASAFQGLCLATLIHRDTDEGASWARLFEHAAHVRASEPLFAYFKRCLHLLKFAHQRAGAIQII